jgi:hypothetical protein
MDTSHLKIIEKGYKVNTSLLQEGWYHDHYVNAKHISTARSMLFNILKTENALDFLSREITFQNTPVELCPDKDLVMFEDTPVLRYKVNLILMSRSRNNELESYLSDPNIQYCYILKRGLFYADNNCGYVTPRNSAGIYTIEDGVSKARSCEDLRIIPIDNSEHNKMTLETIKQSLGRIIIEEKDKNMWEHIGELIGLLELKYSKS